MKNIFKEWFSEFRDLVEEDIKNFFLVRQSTDYHPLVTDVYHDIVDYILRGGRFAASLAMATYKGLSCREVDSNIIRIGTALEIYGFGVLLHDDVFDCDSVRINKDAFHIMYEKIALEMNGKNRRHGSFGESIAIITGNMLNSLALIALNNLKLSDRHIRLLIDNITYGFVRLNESQIVDIVFEYEMPTVTQWYQMARRRASSHVGVCVASGGIVANWNKHCREMLLKLASHLGYMFDIRDDLLDTFAEKGTVFQPPLRDLRMKKKPLHFCYALENADRTSRKILESYMEHPIKKIESKVLEILRSFGLEPARKKIEEHAELANQFIKKSELSEEAESFFLQIVESSLRMIKEL